MASPRELALAELELASRRNGDSSSTAASSIFCCSGSVMAAPPPRAASTPAAALGFGDMFVVIFVMALTGVEVRDIFTTGFKGGPCGPP